MKSTAVSMKTGSTKANSGSTSILALMRVNSRVHQIEQALDEAVFDH